MPIKVQSKVLLKIDNEAEEYSSENITILANGRAQVD